MMTDPIADMLTQIRNGLMVDKTEVVLPHSKLKQAIAEALQREGYIEAVKKSDTAPMNLHIILKYTSQRRPAIESIKRVSKPGRRVYASWDKMPRVLNNYGIAIVSTSRGLLTNREARKQKVGGEIICEVY
ncbi:MAG: 30S ribosomal protein S8 [bacterium]|nr:30S ribosomal protein S8 [bacterium]